jgi:hypothetical protein
MLVLQIALFFLKAKLAVGQGFAVFMSRQLLVTLKNMSSVSFIFVFLFLPLI